jgi:hypothetical protein
MGVHVGRNGGVDRIQEAPKLDGAMARRAPRDHFPAGNIEGGEERGGPVSLVIMGAALGLARAQRQERRGAVERLDLRLLVDAQDERAVGRLEPF